MNRQPLLLLWLFLALAVPVAAEETRLGPGAEISPGFFRGADNSDALAHFREGRYTAAYAAFWPALQRGDPEAIFHGLIIRRNGLDGRPPAQPQEMNALTAFLASRAEFMRQALAAEPRIPESTADAYRTALAQLIFAGLVPLDRPPDSPEQFLARRRSEALALLSSLWRGSPVNRFPPAQNFAAHLNLAEGGSPQKARVLLRKSAEAGDHLGMINLSFIFREGIGGAGEDLRAAHWARRAADSEPPLPRAQNEVGYYYETGRGVTRDLAEARAWYGKSAAQGYPPGRQNAARLKKTGPAEGDPRHRPALDEAILY